MLARRLLPRQMMIMRLLSRASLGYFFPLRYVSNARTNLPPENSKSSKSKMKSIRVTPFPEEESRHIELPVVKTISHVQKYFKTEINRSSMLRLSG